MYHTGSFGGPAGSKPTHMRLCACEQSMQACSCTHCAVRKRWGAASCSLSCACELWLLLPDNGVATHSGVTTHGWGSAWRQCMPSPIVPLWLAAQWCLTWRSTPSTLCFSKIGCRRPTARCQSNLSHRPFKNHPTQLVRRRMSAPPQARRRQTPAGSSKRCPVTGVSGCAPCSGAR